MTHAERLIRSYLFDLIDARRHLEQAEHLTGDELDRAVAHAEYLYAQLAASMIISGVIGFDLKPTG